MPLHTSYKKKNIFIFFSFVLLLATWSKQKILKREVKYYQKLKKKNNYSITFVTYGDKDDLKFKKNIKNINIIPLFKNIKKNFLTKYLILLFGPLILNYELKNCDLIKTHQVTGGLLASLCAKLKKKKNYSKGWMGTNFKLSKLGHKFVKYLILILNSFLSYKFQIKL